MREMKDSGVEWIGEIPTDWEITKIGSVYDERNTKVSDEDYPPLSVTKQGVVPQLETAAKTDNGDNRKLICKNDFVINSRSDRRGSCGISEYEGSCSLINTVLMPQRHMCNRYYGYVFKSDLFADEYYRWGHGIVDDLWSTKWSDMKNIYIPMPKLEEQEHRADYLDTKCSKIDEIIAKQEQIIEKLKEYKLSVITETMTKGLNPNIDMRDSGIEWIGQIPAHWRIGKIKAVTTKIGSGKTPKGGAEVYSSSGVLFLRSQNIYDDGLSLIEPTYITEEIDEEMSNTRVKPGDVLLNITGGSIGRCCIFPDTIEKANVNQHVSIIRAVKSLCIPEYMHFYWNSEKGKIAINLYQTGGNREGMSGEAIGNTPILLPPVSEQREIVKSINERVKNTVVQISRRTEIIGKLVEYKKSLIYEVVTGKKEV